MNDELIKENLMNFIFQCDEDEATLNYFHPLSSGLLKERAALQVNRIISELEDSLTQNFEIIRDEIECLNFHEKEKAFKAFQQIILLISGWKFDETNANLAPVPTDACESIYQIGRELLLKENYQKATRIFSFLLILRPDMEQIWLGLAIAEQRLKHFEIAKVAYQQVLFLDPFHEYSKREIENMSL